MAADPTPVPHAAAAAAAPHARARPLKATLGLLTPLWWVLAAALASVVALGFAARWVLTTEEGTAWLIARLPMVTEVRGLRGAILGPAWHAERLRVQWAGGRKWLVLEDFDSTGMQWAWLPDDARGPLPLWLALRIERVQVRRVQLDTGPRGPRPIPLPTHLAPPFRLEVATASVGELRIDALEPLTELVAQQLVLDGSTGARHRVAHLAGRGYGVQVQGEAAIGNARPFELRATTTVAPALVAEADAPPWAAALSATGPLAEFKLQAALRGRPVALLPSQAHPPGQARARGGVAPGGVAPGGVASGGATPGGNASSSGTPGSAAPRSAALRSAAPARSGPALDATARVRPLEAWPVSRLELRTAALDLSALRPGAPQTQFFGEALLQAASREAPVALQAQLENRLAGPWNEGRIPASRASFEARGELARPDRVELSHFDIELATADGREPTAAGRLEGRAVWRAHQLELDARLAEVRPQRLDGRAPAMVLSGPVHFTIQGLPSPAPAAAGASGPAGAGPGAGPGASASPPAAARNAAAPRRDGLPPWSVAGRVELEGRIDGAPKPVLVRAEGHADGGGAELKHLQVRSGDAQAVLSVRVARNAAREWALASEGSLAEFDPLPWWPGEASSPWRRGPHRLNAGWQFELRAPADAGTLAPAALLPRLAGNGKLRLHDSVLAGVPLAGEATLGYTNPGTGSLRADLQLGGNRLVLEGTGEPAGSGERDRWKLDVQAAQLGALAPLARLSAGVADWLPRRGQIDAQISGAGRWPRLATQGQLHTRDLLAGALSLTRGQASWRLDLSQAGAADAPLTFEADASGLTLGEQAVNELRAELRGTRAAHRLELAATVPVVPGPAAVRMLNLGGRGGTKVALRASGQWQGGAAGGAGGASAEDGGRWIAQVDELLLGAAEAASPSSTPSPSSPGVRAAPAPPATPPWAEARNLRAELQFDAQGRLQKLSAEPGRVVLADSFALRWEAVQLDWRRERADFAFRADIDPFLLPPLLQRWQPTFGWQGDLRLAARVEVRAAERFEANMVFARTDGDLHVESQGELQLLGLTDFRLLGRVREGVWEIEPVFRGRGLGEIRGRLRATTGPERRWPHDDAPLEGQLQLRVPDIGVWGHWAPPGWRLGGELATVAQIGGRFAEPTYTGEITGKGLAVRNLLQGVNVSEGQLLVRLAGSSAQIQTFTLRGGEGRIAVTGSADLGAQPSARLKLTAERFRVLGRVDRMLTASGEAELALAAETSRLEGRFKVDEGLLDFTRADAPSLDEDVTLRGSEAASSTAQGQDAAAANRRGQRFVLGVDIDLGQNLRAKGRGVDTGLTGALRVTNPGGRLTVRGAIDSVRGTYAAYGQKLELERGHITFDGPPDTPRLDILAVRPNLDTRVGLQVSGPLQGLRVRLYSDPEMSETDKLSWLVLGRASDGLGRNDTALLQRAAIALLAGEGEAPTDAFMRRLGIDELSLKQSEGEVRETVVSLGKQLSRRWYLGYERSVNATTGTWQLIYRAAQRFTLRAQSGLENSLDLIWTWRLQPPPDDGGVRKSLPAVPP